MNNNSDLPKSELPWLAQFFIKQREIIEAAETPFAKLAVFVLPIISPLVPAFMTGFHLFRLFKEIFSFQGSETAAFILSSLIALVLELLGYVGAVSFIQSFFAWIKYHSEEFVLPAVLNFLAYGFYLLAMWKINVMLGEYFGTAPIVNGIVGLLSFITVPTSLLAANHLSLKEVKEVEEKRYQESREDKLTKYRIKHGSESLRKVTGNFPNLRGESSELSENSPKHWRKLRPTLTYEQVVDIAHWNSSKIKEVAKRHGVEERTIVNWRAYAKKEVEGHNES